MSDTNTTDDLTAAYMAGYHAGKEAAKRQVTANLWTPEDKALLEALYPNTQNDEIAKRLGRSEPAVRNRAHRMGLRKSADHISHMNSLSPSKFKHGNAPWNKGKPHPMRHNETQFKKGQRSWSYKPVGSVTLKGGVLYKKLNDTAERFDDQWQPLHRWVWEQAHGEIPEGFVVAFKDGAPITNPDELTLDRLELLTKAQIMQRNTIGRFPKPLIRAIRAAKKLEKELNP